MAIALKPRTELNQIQLTLLKLFNRPMADKEIVELRDVLVEHYDKLLKEELDRVVEEKGYTQEDFEKMLNKDS